MALSDVLAVSGMSPHQLAELAPNALNNQGWLGVDGFIDLGRALDSGALWVSCRLGC